MDNNESPHSVLLPQCQFFVVRKKRLCRMTVRPGRQYCGEHEPDPVPIDGVADQRVPCPNDPNHTCYMSKLEKHLTKCNARKGEDPPYIIQNINAPANMEGSLRIPLRDVPEEMLVKLIEKVNKLYEQHLQGKISVFNPKEEHHSAVKDELSQTGRTASSLRHLRQASRLLQLAEAEGLPADRTCYVELGAGKGMMSYYMGVEWMSRCAWSRVLVVDRAALRHKRDNLLPHGERRVRLRADLRHVALAHVSAVRCVANVLGLAKHLCGVATDYAIRCLTHEGVLDKTRGALIATCCHHRCEQAAYCGNEHLQALGVTPEELNIMFSIVSWATCGDGRSRELRKLTHNGHEPDASQLMADQHMNHSDSSFLVDSTVSPRDFTHEYREGVGRKAKALLDYGRVLYLKERGFQVKLCYYVPTTESPENVCIVAKKNVL